jgi:hypothetical protein
MNYYWFCKATRDELRANGANHIIPVEWNGWNAITRIDDKTKKMFIFHAEYDFELMCKFRYDAVPVEISGRQYNRIVAGRTINPSQDLSNRMRESMYGNIQNPCGEIWLPQ